MTLQEWCHKSGFINVADVVDAMTDQFMDVLCDGAENIEIVHQILNQPWLNGFKKIQNWRLN